MEVQGGIKPETVGWILVGFQERAVSKPRFEE